VLTANLRDAFIIAHPPQTTTRTVLPEGSRSVLNAVGTRFRVPILLTLQHRELPTERAAGWISKHFTYWWLEQNGYGRILIDTDKL
jgi:hypothetical protein